MPWIFLLPLTYWSYRLLTYLLRTLRLVQCGLFVQWHLNPLICSLGLLWICNVRVSSTFASAETLAGGTVSLFYCSDLFGVLIDVLGDGIFLLPLTYWSYRLLTYLLRTLRLVQCGLFVQWHLNPLICSLGLLWICNVRVSSTFASAETLAGGTVSLFHCSDLFGVLIDVLGDGGVCVGRPVQNQSFPWPAALLEVALSKMLARCAEKCTQQWTMSEQDGVVVM